MSEDKFERTPSLPRKKWNPKSTQENWELNRNSPLVNITLQSEFKEAVEEAVEELEKVNSITKNARVRFFGPIQEVEKPADAMLARGRRIEYKAVGWVNINPPDEDIIDISVEQETVEPGAAE